MGITLRLRLNGEGAEKWLPVAKAHLAAANARPGVSFVRNVLNYNEAKMVITRSTVVDQIDITTGLPYIFGYFIFATSVGDKVGNAQVDPDEDIVKLLTQYNIAPRIGDAPAAVELARAPYVGDGFVMFAWSNRFSVSTEFDIITWTVLNKLSSQSTQYFQSDPLRIGHSTTFIEEVQMTGTFSLYKFPTVWGCGYSGNEQRYCYGCCGLTDDGLGSHRPTPIVFVGNTKSQQIFQVAYPRAPNRVYFNFSMFVVAPGHMQAIHTVSDSQDPQIPPYIAESLDYGTSWNAVAADFLIPYTLQTTAVGDRARYSDSQMTAFAQESTIQYLGNGKQLLVLSAGLKDMLGDPLIPGGDPTPRYCYMAFLGTNGGGYTRISWPPDDWLTFSSGFHKGTSYIAMFEPTAADTPDYTGMQMAFGKGCIHFTVVVAGVPKFMITRDFGSTWEFHDRPANLGLVGTVLKPYINEDDPGKLIFAQPDYPTGRIRFMTTTGRFNEFKKVGTFIKPKQGLRPNTGLIPSQHRVRQFRWRAVSFADLPGVP